MMTGMPGGRFGFLAVSIAVFIVLGSVLEGLPAMVLFGPLLFPIAQQLGIHLVQYAIVAILAMGIGLFSPPFGVGLLSDLPVSKVSSDEAFGRIWPYMANAGRGADCRRCGALDFDRVPGVRRGRCPRPRQRRSL